MIGAAGSELTHALGLLAQVQRGRGRGGGFDGSTTGVHGLVVARGGDNLTKGMLQELQQSAAALEQVLSAITKGVDEVANAQRQRIIALGQNDKDNATQAGAQWRRIVGDCL